MSGAFTDRTGIAWTKAQPNISTSVFFWNWIHYVNDHAGLVWIAYGTDKSQTGTTPPSLWFDWNPLTQPTPPWSDNSWVVFEAENADPLLNNGGTMPWQCKLQITEATGFDDCNVADINYTYEGSTYMVAGRWSAMGGWNATTLDFSPASGEEASYNIRLWGGDTNGRDENFYLEIVGDDDSIFWLGNAYDAVGYPDYAWQSRGGYMGMVQRRSSAITYPFFATAGILGDYGYGAGDTAYNSRNAGNVYYVWRPGGDWSWSSYSVWKDKTRITSHRLDTWDGWELAEVQTFTPSGESAILEILLAQWQAPKYAIIGELRFVGTCGYDWGFHEVRGTDPQYMQFCWDVASFGGIVMRWPVGIVPGW